MSRNQNPHKRREVNCIGIYINWDEINVGLPRIGGKEDVYKLIDEAFE